MHIADGVLSLEVTAAASAVALGLVAYSFKNLQNDKIVLVASFSALFFVASFIHIPFGPTQIHLMLLGFIGIFLGSGAIFAVALALILQALLLGYGGVVALGANTLIMALPAYLVYLLFSTNIFQKINEKLKFFLVGFSGVFLSTVVLFLLLVFSKEEYKSVAYSIIVVNIPVMILEGVVTFFLLLYIKKSMPELFRGVKI